MICEHCGALNEDSDIYCGDCGSPLLYLRPSDKIYCGRCGAKNESTDIFCSECSFELIKVLPQKSLSLNDQGLTSALNELIPIQLRNNIFVISILGAVSALIVGLLITFLFRSILISLAIAVISKAAGPEAKMIAKIIPEFFPGTGLLFSLGHQAPLITSGSAQIPIVGNVSASATAFIPVISFLFIPALSILAGGFIAASLSTRKLFKYEISRAETGALISIPYALLMMVVATLFQMKVQSNISVPAPLLGSVNIPISVNIGFQTLKLGAQSLLWGFLFGALGGALSAGISYKKIRDDINASLRLTPFQFIVALVKAILTTLVLLFFVSLLASSILLFIGSVRENLGNGVGLVGTWLALITIVPTTILSIYFMAHGIPINLSTMYGGSSQSMSMGIFSGLHLPFLSQGVPYQAYLVMLLPFLALLVYGYVAGKRFRPKNKSEIIIVTTKIALIYSVALTIVSRLLNSSLTATIAGAPNVPGSVSVSSGPPIFTTFFMTIIWAWIAGGLGLRLWHWRNKS